MMTDEPTKSMEQIKEIAQKIKTLLDSELSQQWDTIEKPSALAHYFATEGSPFEIRNITIESVLEEYIGLRIHDRIPEYVQLFDKLKSSGFGKEHAYAMGGDDYVYAVEERDVEMPKSETSDFLKELFEEQGVDVGDTFDKPEVVQVKVLAVETQSRNFLIVLNHRFSKWTLHAREFYETFEHAQARGYLGRLDSLSKDTPITLQDMVVFAQDAARYADDVPGNKYPARYSMAGYLSGSLIAGQENAGPGFRYGDGRDPGYIVSTQQSTDMNPCAKDATWYSLRDIAYVIDHLNVGTMALDEDLPQP